MSSSLLGESAFSCDESSPRLTADGKVLNDGKLMKEDLAESDSRDMETVYRQAVHFLELAENLSGAPQTLKNQCGKLQTLGNELSEAIDNLKQQSSRVLGPQNDTWYI